MIKCDCGNRYGAEITSLKMFDSINAFFIECKNKNIYKEIKIKKPYYTYNYFLRCYADKWYRCRCCGTLWELEFPDEKGGAWVRKFSDGKYRKFEKNKYNY